MMLTLPHKNSLPLLQKAKHLLLTGFALLFISSYGIGQVHSEVITAQMRTEDARLEKPVHPLVASRITVETLLQKLSAAEGIEITLHGSPKGPGQTEVFAILRDTPLADTLNGLCTLLSYDKARWRWTREGTVDKVSSYRYVLWPSFGLPQMAADVQKQIQADFEAQDSKMQAALKMPSSELEQAAKTNTDIHYIVSEDKAGINEQRTLLKAFYGAFSTEQRLRILRGEDLTPERPVTSTLGKDVSPLEFHARYMPGMITPILFIGTKEGLSSSCIGNGMNDEMWRDRISNLWYFGGNRKVTPLENKIIKRPAKTLPLPANLPAETSARNPRETFYPFWSLLWKTSEAVPLSVLAIPTESLPVGVSVSGSEPDIPTEPYGMTLKTLLAPMNKRPIFFQYQCQNNVLLFRDPSAPFAKRDP